MSWGFIDGFVIGMIVGIISTFFGIIYYAKYMDKRLKEAAIDRGREKFANKEAKR